MVVSGSVFVGILTRASIRLVVEGNLVSVGFPFIILAGVALLVFSTNWKRHQDFKRAMVGRIPPQTISVVIPTLDEAAGIGETVDSIVHDPTVLEVIVVDGGSSDDTLALAGEAGALVFKACKGRGTQMRVGTRHAKGDAILFMHADTRFVRGGGKEILKCLSDPSIVAGGCWKTFREKHWTLAGSFLRCGPRMLIGGFAFGDQSLFVRKETLKEVGGFPDVPLMEEFGFFRQVKKVGKVALADATVVTSARRFLEFGIFKTYFLMGVIQVMYLSRTALPRLEAMYHRGGAFLRKLD